MYTNFSKSLSLSLSNSQKHNPIVFFIHLYNNTNIFTSIHSIHAIYTSIHLRSEKNPFLWVSLNNNTLLKIEENNNLSSSHVVIINHTKRPSMSSSSSPGSLTCFGGEDAKILRRGGKVLLKP